MLCFNAHNNRVLPQSITHTTTQGSFENGNKICEADFISSTWNQVRVSAIAFEPCVFRGLSLSLSHSAMYKHYNVFVCGIHSISLIRFECYVLYSSNSSLVVAVVAIRIANVDVARLETKLWIAWNRIAFLFFLRSTLPPFSRNPSSQSFRLSAVFCWKKSRCTQCVQLVFCFSSLHHFDWC